MCLEGVPVVEVAEDDVGRSDSSCSLPQLCRFHDVGHDKGVVLENPLKGLLERHVVHNILKLAAVVVVDNLPTGAENSLLGAQTWLILFSLLLLKVF